MRYPYFFQDKHDGILLCLHNDMQASVLLWQNLLTFCFTKMYFYCIQINDR